MASQEPPDAKCIKILECTAICKVKAVDVYTTVSFFIRQVMCLNNKNRCSSLFCTETERRSCK